MDQPNIDPDSPQYEGEYEFRDSENLPCGKFEVLYRDGEWHWTSWMVDNDADNLVGPFATSEAAYIDAQDVYPPSEAANNR